MIDAKEARKIANELISAKTQAQVESVEKHILQAAESGSFSCQIDGYLLPQVVAYLRGLNYTVKSGTVRNESYTTIKWGEDQ